MAKMVGLSRNIKIAWLDKTVELMKNAKDYEDLKAQLNEYLKFEISSPINLRKTREILLHILYYDNPVSEIIRTDGLKLIEKYPDDRVAVYWSLMLSVYPVFKDITFIIGKLSGYQGEITLSQIKQKMFDEWGERAAVFHSSDKIIATIKALDAIETVKTGHYVVKDHRIKATEVVNYMAYSFMCTEDKSYWNMDEINNIISYFPFSYSITREQIMYDKKFVLQQFGNEITVGINSKR